MGHERIRQILEDAFPSPQGANASSTLADRKDPYLRIHCFSVLVRHMDRSLRFYLEQLGFRLLSDSNEAVGRCATVAPPDGTAILALVEPEPGSEEFALIGHGGYVA